MSTRFACDYAKRAAGCKKCKLQLTKGELRLAKITPNPFVQNPDGGPPPDMKSYFHPHCLFEMFYKARATTKIIEEEGDIEDWDILIEEDKEKISKLIEDLAAVRQGQGKAVVSKTPKTPKAKTNEESTTETPKKHKTRPSDAETANKKDEADKTEKKRARKQKSDAKLQNEEEAVDETSKYNSFIKFCKLCDVIGSVTKHTDKSQAVNMFITRDGYNGDAFTLITLLLPGIDHRVYNMKETLILKYFADIYDLNHQELVDKYKKNGDASIVIREVLEGKELVNTSKSDWSIQKINRWLNRLTEITTEEDHKAHWKFAARRLSGLEIMYLIRLVKKDLRFNAGTKHILTGLHSSAYEAFQSCRDLKEIVTKCKNGDLSDYATGVGIKLGTPVLPMLAEVCRSVEQAMSRCPNGIYAEIKYDGERVQVHKSGEKFTFFSRSLKPVQNHKVAPFETAIPKAFVNGDCLILDAEVLMVDTNTGKPLPFGTLGIHKKEKNARPCLFVFDILRYNHDDLTSKPISERRKILEKHMVEVENSIKFSNSFFIENGDNIKLHNMIWKAIDEGLEGLVLKDSQSKYEPGKRHWLKVKKDYLEEGKMADTADLLVLGAYFGTGSKGGLMSVFLMGVYDPQTKSYRTVTKCGNGPTDAELDRVNKELSTKMKRIDRVYENLPSWLRCSRQLVPDFVIENPEEAPVWEITGAEFSKSENHTADGVSVRFPRLTKIREDKDWSTATNLKELKKLFDVSKIKTDLDTSKEDAVPLYAKDANKKIEIAVKEEEKSKKRKVSKEKDDHDVATEKKIKDEEKSKKRKVSKEEDGHGTPKEKKIKDEEQQDNVDQCPPNMTPCKYGNQCYRANPKHKQDFWHPK